MRLRLRDVLTVLGPVSLILSCGGSPMASCTDQSGRGDTTFNEIKLSCATTGDRLQCQAVADVGGLYVYCPMQQDVTQAAEWIVGDGGTVSQAGHTPSSSPIGGAVIQVLDGLVAGQMATSGVPPTLLPGYLGPFGGPGYYRILGVPPGTYHVRITKDGYASQDRTVTVSPGSPVADFQLLPM